MSGNNKQDRYAELSVNRETYKGVRREADKKVRRKTRMGVEEITKKEAFFQKLMDDALTGGPHSMRLCLALIKEAEEFERLELEDQHRVWKQVKQQNQLTIDAALNAGEAPPEVLPHPEDIVIEPGKPVRIEGPITSEEQAILQKNLEMREAYIIEDALDRAREKRRNDYTIEPWGPTFMAMIIDQNVPNRLQWKQVGFFDAHMVYASMSERELSKLRRKVWLRLGVKVKRDEKLFEKYEVGKVMQALVRTFKRSLAEDKPTDVVEDIWIEEAEAVGIGGGWLGMCDVWLVF